MPKIRNGLSKDVGTNSKQNQIRISRVLGSGTKGRRNWKRVLHSALHNVEYQLPRLTLQQQLARNLKKGREAQD